MRLRLTILAFAICCAGAVHCALHTPQILGNNAVPTDGQRTDVVTPPVPVQTPQPGAIPTGDHFEYQGTAVLEIEVNAGGNVTHAKVIKPVGYGLDEKALETVRTWKFRPAMVNGHPTSVRAKVEIKFRLNHAPQLNASCPIPFAFAEGDWNDPKKLTWGHLSDDAENWWDRQRGAQKFSNLCVASPIGARYAIVWRRLSYTYAGGTKDGSKRNTPDAGLWTSPKGAVEVFQMSEGEVKLPALFTSKSRSSKNGFKEAVNYLVRHPGSSE